MTRVRENRDIARGVRMCAGVCALLVACGENSSDDPGLGRGGAKSHASGGANAAQGGGSNPGNGGTASASGGATSVSNGGVPSNGGTSGTSAGGTSSVSNGGAASTGNGGTPGAGGGTAYGGRAAGGSSGANSNSAGGGFARGGSNGLGGMSAQGGANGGSKATGGSAGTAGSTGTGGTTSTILAPDSGILLGQYYGDASIAATGKKLGRTLPIHLTYYAWDDEWTSGDTKADLNAGRIPLVNWELFGAELDDIVSGTYDSMLAQRAKDAKALGKKFFLDFGAEMNGDWSPWGGAQNGSSAAKYLATYRHVHDALVAGGATNAIWVWCPNVTDEPNESWNRALEYYPGDSYVDWTCVDGYNWGTSNSGRWQSFHDVFVNIYPKLAAKNKPIMIGEMASAEVGGDKAAWVSAMIPTLKADFPLIKALVWFDVNKETDWRISSSPQSELAFVQMVSDPYTNP